MTTNDLPGMSKSILLQLAEKVAEEYRRRGEDAFKAGVEIRQAMESAAQEEIKAAQDNETYLQKGQARLQHTLGMLSASRSQAPAPQLAPPIIAPEPEPEPVEEERSNPIPIDVTKRLDDILSKYGKREERHDEPQDHHLEP